MTVQDWTDLVERAEAIAGSAFAEELAKEIIKDAREEAEARLQHADALEAWHLSRSAA
jgi:vacuolar-type H+-ATPase subunit H